MTSLVKWRHCFFFQEIPDFNIPEEINIYIRKKTGRKTIEGTRKLLGVMKAKKILLYTLTIRWYLQHGLRLTEVHQLVEYEQSKPFSWFPDVRRIKIL